MLSSEMKKAFAFILLFSGIISVSAQDKSSKSWDVNNPPGDSQTLKFTTRTGTWLNLDVSPDGKTIVFDLLGDLYQMPLTGGKAQIISGGMAWESQPRYSPDGKKILFTSDRGGGDNLWVMPAQGGKAAQITKEDFRLLNNGVFTADGQYLIARKHFTSTRSLGAGELWMYHISGGTGIQLTKRKNDQQDLNEPCVSPDGEFVYYSEDVYPGGYFQYNKDPNSQIYVIKRLNLRNGETETVTGGPGGACRPQISRDGKTLAFIRRVRERTVLFLHDLESGKERPLFSKLSKDQQEAWAIFGTYPGFSWHPDGKTIVIWGEGKFWRVDTTSGRYFEIPFEAEVEQKIMEAVRFRQEISAPQFQAKAIRMAVTSPDERYLVFNAAGHLYKKALPNGKPERLCEGETFTFEANFSSDSKQLCFVSWDDESRGAIWTMAFPSGTPKKLSLPPGNYRTPSFSPDGQTLIYEKEGGNDHMGYEYSKETGIYLVSIQGGKPKRISKQGSVPQFMAGGNRVFFRVDGSEKQYKSIRIDGGDERIHFTSKYAPEVKLSPDNQWIAFSDLHKAWLAPFPLLGKTIDLSAQSTAYPVSLLARDAGYSLHWSADSKTVFWTLGNEYFRNPINRRFKFLSGSPDSIPAPDTTGLAIGLILEEDYPRGLLAFKGATLLTMEADSIIKDGIIIIENNRIKAIGSSDNMTIPAEAKVIDVSGKYIMPGIVDVHAHLGTFRAGLSPQKQWSYYANLAFGVTTTHDPSSNSEMVFSQAEAVRSGTMVGPRIFSTGTILYGAEGDFKAPINSLEDAMSALRRTKAWGAFSVKSYNQPRREQRQQVIEAARRLKMNVVPEGGSFFFHNMSMILDGHSGIEHNIPVTPLEEDVIKLWSASKTGYTPTLIVSYGALNGENYWFQKTNVWENNRLNRFTPREILDSRSRHRTMAPEGEYEKGFKQISRDCARLQQSGVKVNLGAHGQLQGLGAHWELWMLAMGGLNPYHALKTATLNGAHYIGMDDEIGSLKAGKLADLIVLDKNPLDTIINTESVRYTMVNGRLYEAGTLQEIGLRTRKKSPFYWEQPGYLPAFPWHVESHSFHQSSCSCRH